MSNENVVNIKSGDDNASSNLSALNSVGGDSATVTLDSTYTGNIYRISDSRWSGFIPNGEFLWHIDITDGKVTTHEVFVQNARYETLGTESLTIDGAIKELKENAGVNKVTLVDSGAGIGNDATVKVGGNLNFYSPSDVRDIRNCGYLPVTKISKHPISGETLAYDLFGVNFSDSHFIKTLGNAVGHINIDSAPTDFGSIKFKMNEDSNTGTNTLTGIVQGADEICRKLVLKSSELSVDTIISSEKMKTIYNIIATGQGSIFILQEIDETGYEGTGMKYNYCYPVIPSMYFDEVENQYRFYFKYETDNLKYVTIEIVGSSDPTAAANVFNKTEVDYTPKEIYSYTSLNKATTPVTISGARKMTIGAHELEIVSNTVTKTLSLSEKHRKLIRGTASTTITYTLPQTGINGEQYIFYKVTGSILVIKSPIANLYNVNASASVSSITCGSSIKRKITAMFASTTNTWYVMADDFLSIS